MDGDVVLPKEPTRGHIMYRPANRPARAGSAARPARTSVAASGATAARGSSRPLTARPLARGADDDLLTRVGGMRTLVVTLLAAAVVGVYLWAPWQSVPEQGACVVGVDTRGSAAPMIPTYQRWAKDVLADCADGGRADVAMFSITGATETDFTSEATQVRFGDLHLESVNDDEREAIVTKKIDRAVSTTFDGWASTKPPKGGTDIIGAAEVARQLLGTDVKGKRTLVLLSDGVQNATYKFHKDDLDSASIDRMIEDLKASGRVPLLDGVNVRMYGTGVGTMTAGASGQRLLGIKDFWSRFFSAAGADLTDYAKQPVE